ncbi:MAG: RNA-guided endonuclease InsQ/TnpB family protein [Waterburya sp.]
MEYKTQKILLTSHIDDELTDYLLWQCHHSNSLYNCALWIIRQSHFADCPTYQYFDKDNLFRTAFQDRLVKASYADLCKQLKDNKHYLALGGQQAQQTIKSAVEGIASYNKLIRCWWRGELSQKPRIPYYRTKNGLYQVAFPAQAVTYDDVTGQCKLATAKENKPELLDPVLIIDGGTEFTSEQLSEVRIVPANSQLWAEYVYKTPAKKAIGLDYSQGISIDPGLNNWLSVLSSKGKSFIICGRKIKSINQRYNKTVAHYKKGKSAKYWDEYLADLTHKRNCQMRDAVNKAARFVINYCLTHSIGNIVFGWGQGIKTNANLGKQNNQNFVAIPTSRLKNRIKELAVGVGIIFTETEEAYSSKSSFLDNDLVPKYGEKPPEYKFSGRRVKRGLYRSAKGILVNADLNGAGSILKKVATQLGISLAEVGKAALTLPKRYNLHALRRSYRKNGEMCLQEGLSPVVSQAFKSPVTVSE